MESNIVARRLRAVITFPVGLLLILSGGALTGIIGAAIASVFYIALLFPLLMGFAGGNTLIAVLQLTRIRNTVIVILLSVLTAAAIYGTYHYGRYLALQLQTSIEMFSGLSPATDEENLRVAKTVVDYALKEETGHSGFAGYILYKAENGISIGRYYSKNRIELGSVLTLLYWLFEYGAILAITLVIGRSQLRIPICESCGRPYGGERHLGGTPTDNESLLLDLVRRSDFTELGRLIKKDADLPSVELYLRCCGCGKSASCLTVRRAFQGSGGALRFSDLLKTTLSPSDSTQFLKQLRFENE